MTSYTRMDGTWSSAAAAPSSKPSARTLEQNAKARKSSRVIRKLGRQLEKTSLDLDRTSAEQGLGVQYAARRSSYDPGSATHSLHDLTYNSSTAGGGRRAYHHRSTSGTSQFSSRTSGSYNRNGSFQHPWQQTPRPYTPPGAASYQDYSGSELDRQRVSFADEEPASVRENPKLDAKPSEMLSLSIDTEPSPSLPRNSSLPLFTTEEATSSEIDLSNTIDNISPSSIRSSMERGFRIRSRSDGGVFERKHVLDDIESVHEARRRFEKRERAKEERAAREHVKAIEKKNLKHALKVEEEARKSAAIKRNKAKHAKYGNEKKGSVDVETMNDSYASGYDSARVQTPPVTEPTPRRVRQFPKSKTATAAKRKTHSAWTTFMIWLRIRLLKMSRKL